MKNWKLIAATLIALIALFALGAACAEATELTYTPGEDLVLVDDNDTKIWITADGWYDDWIKREYKSFTPLDNVFVLAVIDWENKADEPRTLSYNGTINGYSIIDSEYWISPGDLPAHTTFSDEGHDEPIIVESFYEELAEYNNIDEATVKEALKGPEYVLELNFDIDKPLDESGNTSTVLYETGPIIVHYNAENDSPSAKPEDVKPEADTLADTQADTQADTLADTQGDAQADGPSVVYTDKATVKAVQQALNDAGYNCGKPDGAAGKKTKAAITQFQTDKGLEVTGQIDDALLEALGVELSDEEEAQPAEAEQPTYTVDDYIGTWYMKLAYMSERGVTVDPVAQFGLDPYKITLTIEPGKVTIENVDSSEPSTFEGELKIDDGALYVMTEEENYYSNARFLIFDDEDGRFLAWLPSSGDIFYYSSEAPKGPGKVHKDKATVKAVQQALNDAGYECGKPDGAAGKKTKAAITQFQTDKGLEVTGTVTDELLRSLGID